MKKEKLVIRLNDFFSTTNENALSLKERFQMVIQEGLCPIRLVDDSQNVIADCNNEKELLEVLEKELQKLRIPLSYFSVTDVIPLSLEQRILAVVQLEKWPIKLVEERGNVLAECRNEEELREELRNRNIF